MPYEAIITKITNIRNHPNADRINLGTAFGHQVVISKDTKEGTLGVFFPCDGKLGEECLKQNNLYSDKSLNKDPKAPGGFFGKNGRVRAQKFRGAISEGFWSPLNILEFTDIDLSTLKEGDTINDPIICEKYLTPATIKAARNNQQKKSKPKSRVPDFKEHYDTGHLKKCIYNIPEDAVLYITTKLHGTCFSAETKVRMADGTLKKIKNIKIDEQVLGYEQNSKKIISSKVINTFTHNPGQNWYEVIGKRRGCGFGNSEFKILCTESHEFYTQLGYKKIKECSLTDKVYLARNDYYLSEITEQMLLGKFLGDGSLCIRSKVAKLEFSHKEEHKEYLDYCKKILNILNATMSDENKPYKSGYGTTMYRGKTRECRSVYNLLAKYKQNLTEEISSKLNIIGLAFLYMDDGSRAHSTTQIDRVNVAICSYSGEEASYIKRAFDNNGYKATISNYDGYYRLRLNTESSTRFFNDIKEYVPKCMQYKLPKKFRKYFNKEILEKSKNNREYLLVEHDFVSINNIGQRPLAKRYDISTETENFFAHDVLVHNSGRTCRLPSIRKCNWFERLLKRSKTVSEYKYITGSRRVILDTNSHTDKGYYKGTSFRRDIHNKIKNIGLHKGETLYYEIVGYSDNGKLLMGSVGIEDKELKKKYGDTMSYIYGCSPLYNPYKIFIYRITMTSPDGYVTELPFHQVISRCAELKLNHVPIIHGPIIYNGNSEEIIKLCEFLSTGPDELDTSHIKEGVVVRVQAPGIDKAYKLKSFDFLMLEGNLKNLPDHIDLEEIS